jgi:hypothetical protein
MIYFCFWSSIFSCHLHSTCEIKKKNILITFINYWKFNLFNSYKKKTIFNRHYDSRYPSFLFINKTFYKSNAILIDTLSKCMFLYLSCSDWAHVYSIANACPFVIFRLRGRRGRDSMVVGFTTIYAISAYHH